MIVVDNDEWRMAACIEPLTRLNIDKKYYYNIEITQEDLQNPDYLIANQVGVERATINDLVQKIKSRSLEGQLQRVIDKGFLPAVLIEGLAPSHTEMTYESIYGYISSLSEKGITVIHTVTAEHTAQHLLKLHDKVIKGEFKSLKIPVVRSTSDHPTISKLMGIKHVDEKTAIKIKNQFPNVVRFTWACQRQQETGKSLLTSIKGVGKKKADSIANSWLEDW
jgi:ERCC4-type nuclease